MGAWNQMWKHFEKFPAICVASKSVEISLLGIKSNKAFIGVSRQCLLVFWSILLLSNEPATVAKFMWIKLMLFMAMFICIRHKIVYE